MPDKDAVSTSAEFDLPSGQMTVIETVAEQHGISQDAVVSGLLSRSITQIHEAAEESDRSFVEVLADDLGYLD